MDFLSNLRLGNLFNPMDNYTIQDSFAGPIQTPIYGVEPQEDLFTRRLRELYNPSYAAQDQMNQHINNMPQRQEPSGMRKLGGFLSSLSGFGPAGIAGGQPIGLRYDSGQGLGSLENTLYGGHRREMQDWNARLDPLQAAANLEAQRNQQERILANEMIGRELQERNYRLAVEKEANDKQQAERKQTEAERKNQETEELNRQKLELQQKKNEAYIFAQTNKDMKSFIDKDGMLVFVNPADPTKIVRTGIDTGKLNDMEKIQLQIQGRLDAIVAQGGQTRATENLRSQNDLKEIEARGNKQIEVNEKRPVRSAAANKPLTPAQEKQALVNKANKVKADNPDLADWIIIKPGGIVEIAKPSWVGGQGSREKAERARTLVYGKADETKSSATPVIPKDRVKVADKKGNMFTVPISQLEEAKKQGYIEVK